MKRFGDFVITEEAGVFPAKENLYWSQLRRQRKVYTKIVRVDARKLRAAYIRSQGDFATNLRDTKLQHIRDVIAKGEEIDSYPNVAIMPNGRVDVADGRHRLAVAAERGEKIDIGVERNVTDAMLSSFR